jgi:hypothetical protein
MKTALSELGTIICRKDVIVKYCRDGELTNVVISVVLDELTVKYGFDAGISVGLLLFRMGLKGLCEHMI